MSTATWAEVERARLFDDIPSGVVVLDRELHVVDHNQAFERLFGACHGEPCYRVTKGRDVPCRGCPVEATFADGRPRVVEQEGRDRHGRDVHYLVQVTPVRRDGDGPEWVAAMTTDLTATRRLQHEYQTLFEKVPCFVAVINRDHRVVKANEAFRRTFGRPTGERCHRLYVRRDTPCPDCPVDRTFADGRGHRQRRIGVAADGSTTPYMVFTAPLLEDEGRITHVVEMALDLTEHQRLEERLRRADALREALVEATHDGILVVDEDRNVVVVNPAAEDLLGRSRDELTRRPLPEGVVPAELEAVLDGRAERQRVGATELPTKNGEPTCPVGAAAVRLRGDDGPIGTAIVLHDLRDLKRLEDEKLEAERLAAVGQTVAGLAHGIKNIITGLEGGMYVASSGMKRGDEERIRTGWDMLVRNMGRISELTRNLLAFSRGESVECSWTSAAEVARDVVDLYRDKAAEHGIELALEVDREPEPAWMDPDGLHSCLANLVSNAVDACMVSEEPTGRVTVHLTEADDAVVFEIEDTGCGMDAEVTRRAFSSFFTTKGKGGTGLGLLLTRKIVQQHGGSIDFSSVEGEGTTFRVVFQRDRLPRSGGAP
jgi:PAS domain S-box-containing protein